LDYESRLLDDPKRLVQYYTWLLRDPVPFLEPYSADQIDQGLQFLFNNSYSNWMYAFIEPKVPWEARRECIRAIPHLFSAIFAERCSEELSHLDEASENPLNGACYMWWDVLPVHGRAEDPAYAERDREFLDAMQEILLLPSMACQESALHGLGHWSGQYPQYVEAAINRFLAVHPSLRPELRRYAEQTRIGYVL